MNSVLIVEDERALSSALLEIFRREGFETSFEPNGVNVLKLVKEKHFDVILLDLMMPRKGGFEVLEELKKDPETRMIPVIILSILSDDESIKKSLKLGAADYFVKSNHPILEIVEKVKENLLLKK